MTDTIAATTLKPTVTNATSPITTLQQLHLCMYSHHHPSNHKIYNRHTHTQHMGSSQLPALPYPTMLRIRHDYPGSEFFLSRIQG
jgi:hypothetical protein